MLNTLPRLVKPLMAGLVKPDRVQNLVELWGKLRDPEVLIAGKIRSGLRGSDIRGTRPAAIEFIMLLAVAHAGSIRTNPSPGIAALIAFVMAPQVKSELAEIVKDVAVIFDGSEELADLLASLRRSHSSTGGG
jgi:hypothetical protein